MSAFHRKVLDDSDIKLIREMAKNGVSPHTLKNRFGIGIKRVYDIAADVIDHGDEDVWEVRPEFCNGCAYFRQSNPDYCDYTFMTGKQRNNPVNRCECKTKKAPTSANASASKENNQTKVYIENPCGSSMKASFKDAINYLNEHKASFDPGDYWNFRNEITRGDPARALNVMRRTVTYNERMRAK